MPAKFEPKEPFVHFIAEYRMKIGWTQKRLEEQLGASPMTVSRWENYETRVDMPILKAVAEALREPLGDDLLEAGDLLHHPDRPTVDQLLRKLPEDEQKHFIKQIKNAAKG